MHVKPTKMFLITLLMVEVIGSYQHEVAATNITNYRSHLSHTIRINPPEHLIIETISSRELNATWEAPTEGPEPDYYRLKWTGEDYYSDDITYETFFGHSDLLPCTSYTVEVVSVSTEESSPISAKGTTDIEDPPEPTNLELDVLSSKSILVKWQKPDYKCVITTYNIYWEWESLWGGGIEIGDEETNTTSLSLNINELTPYSNVTVCVRASSENNYGPPACNWNITDQDIPSAPILQNATSDYGESEVTWDPPEMENGIIVGYRLTWKSDTSDPDSLEVEDVTTYTLPLTPCESYNITVSAKTISWGSPSDDSEVTILNNEKPESVSCTVDEDGWRAEWTTPYICPVDNYEVTWNYHVLWSGETDSHTTLLDGTVYNFEEEALANTQYNICVVSVTNDDERSKAVCCQKETEERVPGMPVIEEITNLNNARVYLSWIPPEEQNGIIQSYRVSWRASSDSTEGSEEIAGTAVAHEFFLGPCESYNVTVAAATSIGYGDESDPKSVYIKNYVLAEEVRCKNGPQRTVVVSWTAAAPDCVDSSYYIDYNWTSLWSSDEDSKSEEAPPQTSEWELEDVLPYSEFSSCIGMDTTVTEGACCNVITEQEVPGPPEDFNCTTVSNSTINVTWSQPSEVNGVLGNYSLSWSQKDPFTEFTETILGPSDSFHVIQNLRANTTYTVTLKASTGAGLGEESICTVTTKNNNGDGNEKPNTNNKKGAIIGGTVGGVLGLLLIAGITVLTVKRRKQQQLKRRRKSPQIERYGGEDHSENNADENYGALNYGFSPREDRRQSKAFESIRL